MNKANREWAINELDRLNAEIVQLRKEINAGCKCNIAAHLLCELKVNRRILSDLLGA